MAKIIPSLAIPGLSAEHRQFHTQGLYWVACDTAEDASAICRQVIEAMTGDAKATLIDSAQGCAKSSMGLLRTVDRGNSPCTKPSLMPHAILPKTCHASTRPVA